MVKEEDIQEEEAILEEEEAIEEVIEDEVPDEEPDEGEEQSEEDEESEDEEEDEDIISLGDEVVNEPDPEEKKAPRWVKDLRKQQKALLKENKELKAKMEQAQTAPKQEEIKLGKEPELEDFDYDTDKYKAALSKHFEDKRKYEAQEAERQQAQEEHKKALQERMESYNKKKSSLKVRDFEEAEQAVVESLSLVQQDIILDGAENPALLVYALGRSKAKSEALAKIKNPVKFAFEVAKIEANLKVTSRKSKPAPEGKLSTSGKGIAVDDKLRKLEKEAMATGDMNKLLAYERQLKRKKQQ